MLIYLLQAAPTGLKADMIRLIDRFGSSEAYVQGVVYEKQVDVGMSS
jgi:hypothetical protein